MSTLLQCETSSQTRDDSSQAESVQHPSKRRQHVQPSSVLTRPGMHQERPCERQFERGETHSSLTSSTSSQRRERRGPTSRTCAKPSPAGAWMTRRPWLYSEEVMHSERCTVLAHGNGSFPRPLVRSLWNDRPLNTFMSSSRTGAKQENRPEPQLVERIDGMLLIEIHDHIFQVPRSIARTSSSRFQRQRFSSWRDT